VCWDQWYPEGARLTALQGAQTCCSTPPPSAGILPRKQQYGAGQLDAWRTMQRAHAIANGVYVAAVNRVGFEGPPDQGLEFWGSSFIADPFGQLIAEARTDQGRNPGRRVRPRRMDEVRRNWPFLRDRRIDAYGQLTQRWIG
jgi:N-carbamoylputrescine amidase